MRVAVLPMQLVRHGAAWPRHGRCRAARHSRQRRPRAKAGRRCGTLRPSAAPAAEHTGPEHSRVSASATTARRRVAASPARSCTRRRGGLRCAGWTRPGRAGGQPPRSPFGRVRRALHRQRRWFCGVGCGTLLGDGLRRPTDRATVPVSKRVDGIAQIAQQMPAVGRLDSIRRALAGAVGIGAGPIARDHLHAGMLAQPGSQGLGLAVRQQVHDGVAFQVHQRRAVAVATAPSPIIDAQHAWRRGCLNASRAPASPPSASPRQLCKPPRRSVRRAATAATPDRRSAKVFRMQTGARQRNRLARMRSATGRPCQGRSPRWRSYRLWTL